MRGTENTTLPQPAPDSPPSFPFLLEAVMPETNLDAVLIQPPTWIIPKNCSDDGEGSGGGGSIVGEIEKAFL